MGPDGRDRADPVTVPGRPRDRVVRRAFGEIVEHLRVDGRGGPGVLHDDRGDKKGTRHDRVGRNAHRHHEVDRLLLAVTQAGARESSRAREGNEKNDRGFHHAPSRGCPTYTRIPGDGQGRR